MTWLWERALMLPGCWQVLSPTRKEKSSEQCQGRAWFQQHRDASCHQVSFPARQGAERNSRHSDRNISLFPSNKLGSMSGTRAIPTTSRRELSSSFFFSARQGAEGNHAILTETLACFLPGRAKELSAPLYVIRTSPVLLHASTVTFHINPAHTDPIFPSWHEFKMTSR